MIGRRCSASRSAGSTRSCGRSPRRCRSSLVPSQRNHRCPGRLRGRAADAVAVVGRAGDRAGSNDCRRWRPRRSRSVARVRCALQLRHARGRLPDHGAVMFVVLLVQRTSSIAPRQRCRQHVAWRRGSEAVDQLPSVAAWICLRPVSQARNGSTARAIGSTLRIAQQRSGSAAFELSVGILGHECFGERFDDAQVGQPEVCDQSVAVAERLVEMLAGVEEDDRCMRSTCESRWSSTPNSAPKVDTARGGRLEELIDDCEQPRVGSDRP